VTSYCSRQTWLIIAALKKDLNVIKELKNIADGKGEHADDIRNEARRTYEEWSFRVEGIRGLPRWKEMDPQWTPKLIRNRNFVLENEF